MVGSWRRTGSGVGVQVSCLKEGYLPSGKLGAEGYAEDNRQGPSVEGAARGAGKSGIVLVSSPCGERAERDTGDTRQKRVTAYEGPDRAL